MQHILYLTLVSLGGDTSQSSSAEAVVICLVFPAGAVVAILHASPGTECWAGLHAALKQAVKEAAADAPLVYAHRPVLPAACKVNNRSSLGGTAQ
jgi:hypothetical protein